MFRLDVKEITLDFSGKTGYYIIKDKIKPLWKHFILKYVEENISIMAGKNFN